MNDFNFLHDTFDNEFNTRRMNFSEIVPDIILVEDDQILGKTIKKFLEKKLGLTVHYFLNPRDCLKEIDLKIIGTNEGKRPFCLITDITFDEGGIDGLLLIDLLRERDYCFECIAMTGFSTVETAVTASKKDVFKYLTKPFELEILSDLIVQIFTVKFGISKDKFNCGFENTPSKRNYTQHVFLDKFKIEPPGEDDIFCGMIGRSPKMKEIFDRIKKVSSTNSTVLITGESGTGKELVANALHTCSHRVENSIISINCGAIPSELLESELFGHKKGSFTGAISDRKGRFELSHKGTIFLDEIGDMPLLLQVKLLRVLQNKQIEPVGGSESIKIDTRIIVATHRDLEKAVVDGNFREDLYYRLNVIPIRIPSLAERKEDIPLLLSYFLSKFVSADGRNNIEFNDDALELLLSYSWPGNVRELENLIERLVILKGGNIIKIDDLPAKFLESRPMGVMNQEMIMLPDDGIDLKRILSELEDSLIVQALTRTNGNKNQASKLLNMNRTTLIEKMKKKQLLYV